MNYYRESNVWIYELLDWINIEKVEWRHLSGNPNAIHLLEKNQDKVNWKPETVYQLVNSITK
jgi:hypothetical protein